MSQRLQKIDEDIFTISQVFSIEECAALIARAEAIGFEPAAVRTANGPKMMTHIRNNDRVVLEDADLADEMWRRVAGFLPILDACRPCGVDAQLRFYRYIPGQQFRRHKDGSATNAQGHQSKLSYLLYLNEDCDGGWTNFLEFREINGVREKLEYAVIPATGTALLFRHERWHEGTPVSSGSKYVLRSDVFYTSEV